jgi:ribosomal protein RSM22 (predicted rRNA methylase)
MLSPDLPPILRAALERRTHGVSRGDAAMRAENISRTYRGGGNSGAIRSDADALAYALTRMPATFAAAAACLNALENARPEFAPRSLLDVGAGPGTATWAALAAFPSIQTQTLLDANAALRTLALDLTTGDNRLAQLRYEAGDVEAKLAEMPEADLVIASYLIGELGDGARERLAIHLWSKTNDTLLVIEPGTPAGYARIVALRAQLIAQGAHVVAPCPHARACPLVAPDWCHFAQRLARSRAHKHLKGGERPFEDEKFSYVALSRAAPTSRFARVLARPEIGKAAVRVKLCTIKGVEIASAPRRDKALYARFRRLAWGDALS